MTAASIRGYFLGLFALPAAIFAILSAPARAACEGSADIGMPNAARPCAQVEERLRLDPRGRRDISPWGAVNSFAPIGEGGISPAHQRLDGGYGINAPRLR